MLHRNSNAGVHDTAPMHYFVRGGRPVVRQLHFMGVRSNLRSCHNDKTRRINDVPYGDYGVAVFHDENSNGKMDKYVLGIPLEPYGFSNNVRVTFTVKGSTAEVSIGVK